MGVRDCLKGRKGYIHALEGVIAAIVVVLYLNSIVSIPSTTDWETVKISKKSEDILSSLDRTGFLDRTVVQGDSESFDALINTLDRSLSYRVRVSGLPKRFLDVGVMVNNSSTFEIESSGEVDGDELGGLPSSEDDRYLKGDLSDHAHFSGGSVPFVLSDTDNNGMVDYESVNFDFDGDSSFGDSGEGPYNFTDRFVCNASISGCSGSEVYEVGSFNTSLVLYDGSTAESLSRIKSRTSIGGRTVKLDYDTFNPSYDPLSGFDALWVEGWGSTEISEYERVWERFLGPGRFLMIHSPVDREDIDPGYLSQLGFDYMGGYDVPGSETRNIFYSLHGPGNDSYRSSQYYLDSGIRSDRMVDEGSYYSGNLTIQGQEIGFRVSESEDSVSFGTEGFEVGHEIGDIVILQDNSYRVKQVKPLVLDPEGQQWFDSFETERIDADYHVTRMDDRSYNITEYDTTASVPDEGDGAYGDREDLPSDYSDGVVGTVCDAGDNPYRMGDVTVEGEDYTFLMVNFEPEAPCDQYFEYVYFDLEKDGDFDDDSPYGFSGEGPYQKGDLVNFSGSRYEVVPHLDGEGIDLNRVGQREVGEFPISRDVFGRGGSAGLVRRGSLGHDDLHLITSVMAVETEEETDFTRKRSLGDTSMSHTYTSSTGYETSRDYSLSTVWWFQ